MMADFSYQADDAAGRRVSGTIAAASRDAAYADLRRQGLSPRDLRPARTDRALRGRIPVAAQLSWAERMATLIGAGLPVERALALTSETTARDPMAHTAAAILADLRAGQSLTEATRTRGVFRASITGLLAASERTGNVAGAFSAIAEMLEKSLDLRRTVMLALTYPAILALAALVSVALMLGFIVPQFEGLIGTSDRVPPLAQAVLAASRGFRDNLAWIGLGFALIILVMLLLARSPNAGALAERIGLRLPLVGPILRDLTIATLSRNLGTFLAAGVPMLEAIDLAADTVPAGRYRARMHGARAHVASGGRLSAHLAEGGLFPRASIDMMRAGEESAALDRMVLSLADSHEKTARAAIKRVLTLLEPALILVIGLIIGGIVFAIFQAILSINDVVL